MHPPGEDELVVFDWAEERDKAREKIFDCAKQYFTWGMVRRIPQKCASAYLRCDYCKSSAEFVSWNKGFLCQKHARAFTKEQRQNYGWRGEIRRQEALYQVKLLEF